MVLKEKLKQLTDEKGNLCVTISLNTHRTHPENAQDEILLKNLIKEAEERVTNEFGKRPASSLLEKLSTIKDAIDTNYNLDSLHIFISNTTSEVIKTSWPVSQNSVSVGETFAVRHLIKAYNRSESYHILLLSQNGVHLFEALNDSIVSEIKNEDFPFSDNKHYNTHADKGSDSKHLDDLVREYLNKVDKALVKYSNESNLSCIVICTEDNYSRLLQVADKPSIYLGFASIDYNKCEAHQIAAQGWELIKEIQSQRRLEAIEEMKEAIGHGKVITDLQEIYQAAIDGRGELLIVHPDFSQAVKMTADRTFSYEEDPFQPGVIDDITSNIAWEVLAKKGRVVFTDNIEDTELGKIILKTRF